MENIETLLAAVAQTQGFDFDESTSPDLGLRNSPEVRRETELDGGAVLATPAEVMIGDVDKKKRGRPARGQLGARIPAAKRKKEEDEDEDVCFICFDGGSLVLCDRKGCPKAYHPACIKRDEKFFQSKAKWTCGWHICSVCRKASHYLCYTCTYSLCKACTKDADYVCVRRNKGFCSTCMKTIMLLENKGQTDNDSVQVDFDDKLSWEYLFKVYWVYVKEKLSLTVNDLRRAKNPWKGVTAATGMVQISNAHYNAANGKVSISYDSPLDLEKNKPHEEVSFPQNERVRTSASGTNNLLDAKEENAPCQNKVTENPSMDRVSGPNIDNGSGEADVDKAADKPNIEEDGDNSSTVKDDKPHIEKDGDNSSIVKDTDKPVIEERDNSSIARDTDRPCICRNRDEPRDQCPDNPGIDSGSEWASKDLLEFVAHMKNGDTSAQSQFDVQTLLLDYIKKNNLRDPRRKSQIICDLRLSNLFGKPRVGHIEMLKLLEFHFLVKDTQKNSFIPAGLVGSSASDLEVDGNKCGSSMPINSRKRKSRKKSEERVTQDNLNEYAAIDFHNINLIYLRRNLMEDLIEDKENFNDKVVGSIVRIRISTNDQKPEIYRLVQVVGTSKGPESYKIGDKTADIMLEVLNLDKKEAVSVDSLSNQEFTEDECRRLRQSIRCGLMKQFTVGELQKKAMELQPVRVNDWLKAEILKLNHLRDLASEKGRKKELRECIQKLQLLKSPEERQRRVSEVPYIHADPKMNPNYESEEEARSGDTIKKDENLQQSHSVFTQNGRKTISSNKRGKKDSSVRAQNSVIVRTDAGGSRNSEKHTNQVNATKSAINCGIDQAAQRSGVETSTATISVGNSSSANSIETEKLWHYRDPNAKIQGPFSMMQLRKWNTTGLFPPDMRIWTNHEQYDSLLLTDALNGYFHGASKLPDKHTSAEEHIQIGVSEGANGTGEDGKQTETALSNSTIVLSDDKTGSAVMDKSSSPAQPQCLDLNKDKNPSASDVQARNILSPSSLNVQEENGNSPPSLQQTTLCNRVSGLSDGDTESVMTDKSSSAAQPQCLDLNTDKNSCASDVQACNVLSSSSLNVQAENGHSSPSLQQTTLCNHVSGLSDGNTESVMTDKSSSAAQPRCLDLNTDKNSSASDVQACNLLSSSSLNVQAENGHSSSSLEQTDLFNRMSGLCGGNTGSMMTDKSSSPAQPECLDLNIDKNFSASDVQARSVLSSSSLNVQAENGHSPSSLEQTALCNHVSGLPDGNTVSETTDKSSSPAQPQCLDLNMDNNSSASDVQPRNVLSSSSLHVQADNGHSSSSLEQTGLCNRVSGLSDGNAVSVVMDKLSSPTQPQCLDLNIDNNFSANDVQARNVLSSSSHDGQVDNEHSSSGLEHNSIAPPDPGKESGEVKKCSQSAEKDSSAQIQNHVSHGDELQNQSNYHGQTLLFSEEKLRSLTMELFSNDIESDSAIESIPESAVAAVIRDIDVFNFPSPTPETSDKHTGVQTTENQQSISSDVPVQSSCILELLSPMPRSNIEDQKCYTNETNHSQITDFLVSNHGPSSSNPSSLVVGTQLPEVGDEWFGYSPTPAKLSVQEWDFALGPPQVTSENVTTSTVNNDQHPHASNLPSWMFMDGPIEFDALGEESVSDLLAEVDAMESQGNFPSPTSAMKFAKELIEDCKDECFSSVEFNPIPYPAKTDAMSSTGENQSTSQAPMPYKSIGDALDSFRRSDVHSSTSSMGETNASGYSGESASEFHPPAPNNTNQEVIRGSEHMDPGWGTVQGNINLVTVQGNVNLVLGGPGQGMPNINWGANPGSGWVNPNMNNRYGGERYTSPREWGYQGSEAGFGRGRAPWGRQPYGGGGGGGGGGGYLRPPPKGQRVCKFYESGRCRKGAFCDYLHPS